jgi:hypothetical protein
MHEVSCRVPTGKHLSDAFLVHNVLKQVDALFPLLFNFAVQNSIMKVQENQEGMQLNGLNLILVHADDVNLLGGGNINMIENNAETLYRPAKYGTKYVNMTQYQNQQ